MVVISSVPQQAVGNNPTAHVCHGTEDIVVEASVHKDLCQIYSGREERSSVCTEQPQEESSNRMVSESSDI